MVCNVTQGYHLSFDVICSNTMYYDDSFATLFLRASLVEKVQQNNDNEKLYARQHYVHF